MSLLFPLSILYYVLDVGDGVELLYFLVGGIILLLLFYSKKVIVLFKYLEGISSSSLIFPGSGSSVAVSGALLGCECKN